MSDSPQHGGTMNRDVNTRKAWLEVGGFIAAADGLSDAEKQALSLAGAGPDISADEALSCIAQGASASALSNATLATVSEGDIAFRVDCLLDVYMATASDGMSGTEWHRFSGVASQIVGDQHVDALIRLCLISRDSATLRKKIVLA